MSLTDMQPSTSGEITVALGSLIALLTALLALWRKGSKTKLEVNEDANRNEGLVLSSTREKETYRIAQEALKRDQASQIEVALLRGEVRVLTSKVEELTRENEMFRRALRKISPEFRLFTDSSPGGLDELPPNKK